MKGEELAAELFGIAQRAEMIEHLSHMIDAKVRDLAVEENVTGIALLVEAVLPVIVAESDRITASLMALTTKIEIG